MVDATRSGRVARKGVKVQLLSLAPNRPGWWKGRHVTLRALWEKSHVGSSPAPGTNILIRGGMVELPDTLVLGTSTERCESWNLSTPTKP